MPAFGEIAERLRRSAVKVRVPRGRGSGSGVIWNRSGLILTNSHVAQASDLEVELWAGRRLPARVATRDPRRDLAALQMPASDVEPAVAGDSGVLRPGELVIAVGNPFGFAGAVSTGVVHSIGAVPGMGGESWVRADVRLAPGNSGGPLADAAGRVIGINTAIVNGLGLAIPSNAAADFLRRGPRPALGVTLRPVPFGLLLLEVDLNGAAAAASLKPGDVLLGSLDQLNARLDSGAAVLHIQFFRGEDYRRIRETAVALQGGAAAAEAA